MKVGVPIPEESISINPSQWSFPLGLQKVFRFINLMSTENKDLSVSSNQEENKINATASDSSVIEGATPLPTYDKINAEAQVVTQSTIEERIAKAAQASPDKAQGPLSKFRNSGSSNGSEGSENSGEPRRTGSNSRSFSDHPRGKAAPRNGNGAPRRRRENQEESDDSVRREKTDLGINPRIKSVPNFKEMKNDDEEKELDALFSGKGFDQYLTGIDAIAGQDVLEEGTKVKAKILSLRNDCAFVDIGAREQGSIPLKQFPEDQQPAIGQVYDAIVSKFNQEDGMYDIALPLAALEVGDWSSVVEGMIVEAKVTGANKGGLDCEVGHIRAFLPISQISIVRVENIEMFIGEKWKCIVTESNPERRNLVISRRALLEKEREEQREKLMGELEVGQIRDGVVRRLIDVGAFVDLGGVDGFIPISAMSWGRIKHPSAVLNEGDHVKVKIVKIDTDRDRISLSLRDEAADPWNTVDNDLLVGNIVRGRIVNIKPYGAFIEIQPGVDGFVHISEISYIRIGSVTDVLKEDEWVDSKIISIDPANRKISLSIRQCSEDPRKKAAEEAENQQAENDKEKEAATPEKQIVESVPEKLAKQPVRKKGPLQGGIQNDNGGARFGLKW